MQGRWRKLWRLNSQIFSTQLTLQLGWDIKFLSTLVNWSENFINKFLGAYEYRYHLMKTFHIISHDHRPFQNLKCLVRFSLDDFLKTELFNETRTGFSSTLVTVYSVQSQCQQRWNSCVGVWGTKDSHSPKPEPFSINFAS